MADIPKTLDLDFDGYWREPSIGSLPAASGIYCVYACTHDAGSRTVSLKKLIYIGESVDVRCRVGGHERVAIWKKELPSGQVLCFSAAGVSPAADRERAEAAMIFQHQPPANTSCKDVFPYDTTTINVSGRAALLTASFTVKNGATSVRRS